MGISLVITVFSLSGPYKHLDSIKCIGVMSTRGEGPAIDQIIAIAIYSQ